MQKILNFDTRYTLEIKEERIKGFLFKFKPMYDNAGTPTVCDIADLNKIDIDVKIRRARGNGQFDDKVQFSGNLLDYLVALYGQTTRLELNIKKTTAGYLCNIDLTPAVINLKGEDVLEIQVNIPKSTYTQAPDGTSSIEFHSMATSARETTAIPVVKAFPIGNGESNFDKFLGNGVVKVVVGTDFTTDYLASVKSKVVSGDLKGISHAGPFEKSFTEPVLLAENMAMFDNNPESDVEDLVVYMNENPLNKANLKFKLDKPADINAKVLVVALESAR